MAALLPVLHCSGYNYIEGFSSRSVVTVSLVLSTCESAECRPSGGAIPFDKAGREINVCSSKM